MYTCSFVMAVPSRLWVQEPHVLLSIAQLPRLTFKYSKNHLERTAFDGVTMRNRLEQYSSYFFPVIIRTGEGWYDRRGHRNWLLQIGKRRSIVMVYSLENTHVLVKHIGKDCKGRSRFVFMYKYFRFAQSSAITAQQKKSRHSKRAWAFTIVHLTIVFITVIILFLFFYYSNTIYTINTTNVFLLAIPSFLWTFSKQSRGIA